MTDEVEIDPQAFRRRQLGSLPARSGVYALCDLDCIPIYIGKSERKKNEGIGPRVRRHLTSARSDVVANRQLDVWEIAYVWAWPVEPEQDLVALEAHLYHEFDKGGSLINGTVPPILQTSVDIPQRIDVQVMTDIEIDVRKQPRFRFPRQVQQFNQLLDYMLHTKDARHLRRALEVHFRRVSRFYADFLQV